jgi:hypothetical protein
VKSPYGNICGFFHPKKRKEERGKREKKKRKISIKCERSLLINSEQKN